nr:retrovirus-related Pol polyprotein from transposon TNT 1-94 [Tanacetum cinerariifolium]
MTGAKFDIEKFNETGDFGLWRIKMHALLIQHGCEAALEGDDYSGGLVKARDFVHDKSLANKFYLKKKLYTFYMPAGRKIFEHIDEFNKIVLDLANIEVKFEDEDLALLLLTSLPASYEHFVDTLLYGREALNLEDLVDNKECKIKGIGKVRAQLKDGSSFVLHNVRYIPELKRNLISLGNLKKEGYTIKSQSSKVKMINGSRAILSRIRRDNCVYSLDDHAIVGAGKAEAVWQEKSRKAHYSGSDRRYSFRLIGSVLGGVIGRLLNGRKLVSINVIDLWLCWEVYAWIRRILSSGYGVLSWIHLTSSLLTKLVENQTGRTVKKLRTDNGLEFCNQEFDQLCIESGIARHLTVVETPQQNGVAEQATCTTAYLINRSPSRAIEKKTAMEMWSGHPSDYGMLRIFGCVAYPHDKCWELYLS